MHPPYWEAMLEENVRDYLYKASSDYETYYSNYSRNLQQGLIHLNALMYKPQCLG